MSENTYQKPRLSKSLYQRQIPLFLLAVIAGLFLVQYFIVPVKELTAVTNELLNWSVNMSAIALIFGQIMLISRYGRILHRKPDRRRILESAVFFGSFAFIGILGLVDPKNVSGPLFNIWFTAIIIQFAFGLGTTQFPAQINAVFQRFKFFDSPETFVFVVVYLLSLLRFLSVFSFYVPSIGPVFDWIVNIPHTAANRAALIGTGVGEIIVGLRALVGKEPGLMEYEAK